MNLSKEEIHQTTEAGGPRNPCREWDVGMALVCPTKAGLIVGSCLPAQTGHQPLGTGN